LYSGLEILARIIFQPQKGKIVGVENIPQGPFVLAANHISSYDPILIATYLSPYFSGKKMFFLTREWVALIFAPFQKFLGMIPARVKNLTTCQHLLENGHPIGIFIVRPKHLSKKIHATAARLAKRANVPILPLTIRGKSTFYPTLTDIRFFVRTIISSCERKDLIIHPSITRQEIKSSTPEELTKKLGEIIRSAEL
jgi:1-acyl-sn-glycerol-3-phosphate acyltransferase